MAEKKTETPGKSPTIRATDNGPLLVSNLESLQDSRGKTIETRPRYALCRCGKSGNKPFCDSSHRAAGFSSDNTADRTKDTLQTYPGHTLSIQDNRFLCAHMGICTERLPAVFKLGEEPWIDPDGEPLQAIEEIVRHCPSGALSIPLHDGHPVSGPPMAGITVSRNGPYLVTGDATLEGAEWSEHADQGRFALCRCGASRNKPFCDGSHWEAGFNDEKN